MLAVVKGIRPTAGEWAARYRKNLLEDGALLKSRFLLIATAERMYFWRQRDLTPDEKLPDFTLDGAQELKPYLEGIDISPEGLHGEPLRLTVFQWLLNLANTGELRAQGDPSLRWLSESGLLADLKTAHIEPSLL